MKALALLMAVCLGILAAGCNNGSGDDSSVKGLPASKPASEESQKAAQTAIANDPKAAADAPRGDGK